MLCGGPTMIRFAIGLFVIAGIAFVFGYGGIATDTTGVAKGLFMAFTISAVFALIVGLARR